MGRMDKRTKTIDLGEVKALDLKYEGGLSVEGENCRLELGFHYGYFTFIKFTIEDTNLDEMIVSSGVEDWGYPLLYFFQSRGLSQKPFQAKAMIPRKKHLNLQVWDRCMKSLWTQ